MAHLVKGDDTQRELPLAGLQRAVCVDAYDLGYEDTTFGPKLRTMIVWELGEKHPKFEGPFRINRKYTTSIHPESNLGKDLVAWRGRDFTSAERKEGFDVEKLIGVGCHINVVHKRSEKSETVWANVGAIIPMKREEWLQPSGLYVRKTDQPVPQRDAQQEDEARQRYSGSSAQDQAHEANHAASAEDRDRQHDAEVEARHHHGQQQSVVDHHGFPQDNLPF